MKNEDVEKYRSCLECGRELPPGRSDMKFCSPSCRSRYNYRKAPANKGLRLRTINAINRNYDILESLLEDGCTTMDIPDLSAMGYNFDCITSYHKVRNHNEYRCYDIKYYKSESRIFGLSRCVGELRKPGKK
ncbi:MAG: hypothetical protein ACI4TJ_03545 [Candidatus Cryptobacteroides sp.]